MPLPAVPPLILIVELMAHVIAEARANAAFKHYSALKTEASMASITFSDTTFAALLSRKCCMLSKAFNRTKEPTPIDGKFVMQIEQRVASYRADLEALKRDLSRVDAAKDMVSPAQPPTCVPRSRAASQALSLGTL